MVIVNNMGNLTGISSNLIRGKINDRPGGSCCAWETGVVCSNIGKIRSPIVEGRVVYFFCGVCFNNCFIRSGLTVTLSWIPFGRESTIHINTIAHKEAFATQVFAFGYPYLYTLLAAFYG